MFGLLVSLPAFLRAARQFRALLEAILGEATRHARDEVQGAYALLGGNVAGRHAHSAEARHVGLDHVERGRRGRGGIESVAALGQKVHAGLSRERMGRGNDAVQRCDSRTLAIHDLLPGSFMKIAC